MNKYRMAILLSAVLVLGACGNGNSDSTSEGSTNDGEAVNENGAIDHGVKDKSDEKEIGFSLTGDTIEEAQNVPEEERVEIIAAIDEYITTFNEKDIDAYMDTISKETESFDFEEERTELKSLFEQYDLKREISDITITKYSESDANVFTTMVVFQKDLVTEEEQALKGRQVTVLTKEDGEWKVASVHVMSEQ